MTNFNLIRLHFQKKVILEMFMPPSPLRPTLTEYFTVKSGEKMDFASVIAFAMNSYISLV